MKPPSEATMKRCSAKVKEKQEAASLDLTVRLMEKYDNEAPEASVPLLDPSHARREAERVPSTERIDGRAEALQHKRGGVGLEASIRCGTVRFT